ncbi:hypothetical protein [Ruegeria atlantica]|uniref:hypothetical protein n=1 Tax=Ruegeria atlantica TaxID=81569 RepID=UPI001481B028|nr:hypothetical protein [Ruegeria atlantica]
MTPPSNALHNMQDLSNVGTSMRDDCRRSARVSRPSHALKTSAPAIFGILLFEKRDGVSIWDTLAPLRFAKHGCGHIRLDMRGNDSSEDLIREVYTRQALDNNWWRCSVWEMFGAIKAMNNAAAGRKSVGLVSI